MKKVSFIIAYIMILVISYVEISFTQWVQTSFLSTSNVISLAYFNKYLFAGIDFAGFCSTDNGASWTSINYGLKEYNMITSFAIKGSFLFVGLSGKGSGGIFLSTQNGNTWKDMSAGQIHDVSAIVTDSTNIYVAANDGIYCSTDNGLSWLKIGNIPTPNTLSININGLFAGTNFGVYYSPDKQYSWIHSNNGLMDSSISALAVCADGILVGTNTGVYFSSDLGVHWNQSITGLTNRRIHCFASRGTSMFVGTEQGVFLSTNSGRQWAPINDGLPSGIMIRSIIVSDSFLVVGSDFHGLWRRPLSEITPPIQCDSLVDIFPLSLGDKWTYNYSLSSNDYIEGSYSTTGTVYFQIIGKSIFSDSIIWTVQKVNNLNCTHNGMMTRDTNVSTLTIIETLMHDGIHRIYCSGFPFYQMPFDSTSINRYAYVDTSGLWNYEVNKGRMKYVYIFKRNVGAMSYSAMDMCTCEDYVYEFYTLISSHITGIKINGEINDVRRFRLDQNYPNPFNPSTTISFYLPSHSFVKLIVYDITGKDVSILINGELPAGFHRQRLNTMNLSSGVYFYQLQVGSFSETKKLVLLR